LQHLIGEHLGKAHRHDALVAAGDPEEAGQFPPMVELDLKKERSPACASIANMFSKRLTVAVRKGLMIDTSTFFSYDRVYHTRPVIAV
jgi:hypothetical protein